jgi:flagellar biosynthesis/type III secretory pathway M-ring protein FliF/YscJ
MTTKKHNPNQLTLNFEINETKSDVRAREVKRAREILVYINRVHQCLNDVYEHLVDREYQDFQDEVEAAIEYLEYLRDNGDKKF